MTSCIHPVPSSKRVSSSITPMINSVWKFLPRWVMSSSMLEFEKVLFYSEHPIELMDQEDCVMEHNTRRVLKHSLILQGVMSPMHRKKSCMGNREVFLLSTYPISSSLHGQCIIHRFMYPPLLHKYRDEISFKRGGL
jgi:hypothetical protein